MDIKYLILLLINNLGGEISTKNEIHGILYFYSLVMIILSVDLDWKFWIDFVSHTRKR